MSASFIAANDFRQRIETRLPHASSEVIGTSEETLESAPRYLPTLFLIYPIGWSPWIRPLIQRQMQRLRKKAKRLRPNLWN